MNEPTEIASTTFTIDGLVARPYQADDAQALLASVRESIDSVGRWLSWCHAGYGEAESAAWIAQCEAGWKAGDQFVFGIFDGRELLGAVGLGHRNREHNFAGIGYWVRTSSQGRGIAARVAKSVVQFGFTQVKLSRIEIIAASGNLASCRTAQSIGAQFEGIARNRLVIAGQPVDAAMYALVG